MKRGSETVKALLSFVGTNDAGNLNGKPDGAILTVFRKLRFDEVHLLWNPAAPRGISFEDIAKHVRFEIEDRGYARRVSLHRFDCKDVTDHNEIYPKLLAVCNALKSSKTRKFTAAIASGTPAMQVCWILMAE
jgi:sigma54-dependent transcription regulator